MRAGRGRVLTITGDADVMTPAHRLPTFRLLGGGIMSDMRRPHAFTEPFLKCGTRRGLFP